MGTEGFRELPVGPFVNIRETHRLVCRFRDNHADGAGSLKKLGPSRLRNTPAVGSKITTAALMTPPSFSLTTTALVVLTKAMLWENIGPSKGTAAD